VTQYDLALRIAGLRGQVKRPFGAGRVGRQEIADAATARPKKLLCSSSSTVAFSDAYSACQSSNPGSGKTRCVACRCSQTPPLTAELPLACVAWALPIAFLRSSSYFNTDASTRTGVLVRRLRTTYGSQK